MRDVITVMKLAFSALGGALGAVLGGWDGFLYALVAFMVIDYLTGFIAAFVEKNLSSAIGFRGIAKKVVILCLVAIANIIDVQIIGNGSVLRTAVIFFYLSNEGVSILENASRIGLPFPKKLKDALIQIRKEGEGDDEEDEQNDK